MKDPFNERPPALETPICETKSGIFPMLFYLYGKATLGVVTGLVSQDRDKVIIVIASIQVLHVSVWWGEATLKLLTLQTLIC